MKSVIEILNPDDAAAIASAKLLYSDSEIEGQLAFIKGEFQLLNTRNHMYTGERCKSGKFSDFTLKS